MIFRVCIIFLFSLLAFNLIAQDLGKYGKINTKNQLDNGIKKISHSLFRFEKYNPKDLLAKDSVNNYFNKAWRKIKNDLKNTHGYVGIETEYGLNTVLVDTSRSIGGIFTTNGSFSTSLIGMPVNLSFNYSTLRTPLGANNYFRMSLDKDRLIKQQKDKLKSKLENLKGKQAILKNKQAKLKSLLGYAEVYLKMLKDKAQKQIQDSLDRRTSMVKDSINKVKEGAADKLAKNKNKISDTSGLNKVRNKVPDTSSLNKIKNKIDYQTYYDRLNKIYQKIRHTKDRYDSISKKMETTKTLLNNTISKFDSENIEDDGVKAAKNSNFFKSIKTLDIGLSYPKTTAISDQNVPIKGINSAFQFGECYLSVASGLTLNNLMVSPNDLTNELDYSKNVFNNFDFQHIKDNGWLTTVKTGYGTPEGTHAFVGFNYLTNTRFILSPSSNPNQTSYDPAASMELDLRYVPSFYKGGKLDFVYGKTSMNKNMDSISQRGTFESLFSDYPSNLLLTEYTQSISKIRSSISVSYRRIDAFANTTTYGVMQPNNQRFEIKTKHRINKFLNLKFFYRLDETLKALNGLNNVKLNMIGGNLSGNYSHYLNYSFFVNDVHHRTRLSGSNDVTVGNSYLFGITLNSNYKVNKKRLSTTFSYNDYLISDLQQVNKFSQLSFLQSFKARKYSLSLSYEYFYEASQNITTGTSVVGIKGVYKMKKLRLEGGLKQALEINQPTSLGGHIEIFWHMNNFIDIGARAERFVLGGFYRNYMRAQYERFPYLFTIKTKFKI